jgi:glycosyltransferase involved in cell wall biosynthesis
LSREAGAQAVADSSFAIVANGFADGPAQALRDYLVGRGAKVVTVFHPLTREQGTMHVVAEYVAGEVVRTRDIRIPLRPPLSFAVDAFIPLRLPRVDIWFGFNPLACARGLAARRLGRAERVVLWSVDFVPDRFGRGTPLTNLYDRLDRRCCTNADVRVELSDAAREARDARHGLTGAEAPTHVVPMGAWLERVPTVPPDGYRRRAAVFLGHLVPRQGVTVLLDAIALLRGRGDEVTLEVIGGGEQESELREKAHMLGLDDAVRFHGFVTGMEGVERLLAAASVAVAPYAPSEASFTRWADPGKLKAYLAAGLPIVLTEVPPNAIELARDAGAEIVPYDAQAIADAIARALASPDDWRARRSAGLAYARRFNWPALLSGLTANLGLR